MKFYNTNKESENKISLIEINLPQVKKEITYYPEGINSGLLWWKKRYYYSVPREFGFKYLETPDELVEYFEGNIFIEDTGEPKEYGEIIVHTEDEFKFEIKIKSEKDIYNYLMNLERKGLLYDLVDLNSDLKSLIEYFYDLKQKY